MASDSTTGTVDRGLVAILGGVTIVAIVALLTSCSDYDVWDDENGGPQADDDAADDDAADDDTADDDAADDDDDTWWADDDTSTGDDDTTWADDDDGDDDTADDDGGEDDDAGDEDCPNGVSATVTDSDGDGMVVITTSSPEDWAIVEVPVDGVYEIYDSQMSESGSSQMNESGYIRITNSVNPTGFPVIANCGLDYVVADTDNNGTPTAPIYVGTFSLMSGEQNMLTLYHYCPLFQGGSCPSFHNGDPNSGSGCNTNNANSIHMDLDGICIVHW